MQQIKTLEIAVAGYWHPGKFSKIAPAKKVLQ